MGELIHGKYADDFQNVHPDILQRYGNEGKHLGFVSQIMVHEISEDLDQAIAGDQDRHIRHEAIEVVDNQFPFNSVEGGDIFTGAFNEVRAEGIIPEQMGVAETEWEDGVYGEIELVKVGRKEAEVVLPFEIWWPRAVAWAQGLEIMTKIQAVESGELNVF